MNKLLVLTAMAVCSLGVTPAAAATTVNFTSTGFNSFIGTPAPAPISTLTGSFSYDYTGGSFTLTGFSLDLGSTHFGPSNTLASFDSGTGELDLGGSAGGGIYGFVAGINDFQLQLYGFNPLSGTNGGGASAYYTTTTAPNTVFANFTSTTLTPAVPEPATWAMMLLGFAGIGFAMRRNRVPLLARA